MIIASVKVNIDVFLPSFAMPHSPLDRMFNPRSVAVIGASRTEGKIGNTLVRNIVTYGYEGAVYPINQNPGEVYGKKIYATVQDVPGDIDLAVVAVPAPCVRDEVENCGKKGIKHIVIVSSGFKEIGKRKEEMEVLAAARKYGSRILGPNVFGFFSRANNLNCTFGPAQVAKGNIAIITQSGALGIALIGKTIEERIGLSGIISLGKRG